MPQSANELDELAAQAVLASGIAKTAIIAKIRDYLTNTDNNKLRTEITQINSLPELQLLYGAGIKKELQTVFHQRYSDLSGQGGLS